MRADPADQLRLLEVQADDSRLDGLAHRRRTHPALAEIARLTTEIDALADRVGEADTALSDLRRSGTRAEGETATVRARLDRNNSRLASGQGSAKDLAAISHENEALQRRIGVLEEVELEVMEQLEQAGATRDELAGELDGLTARRDAASAERDAADEEIRARVAELTPHREAAAAQLPEALAALYARKRAGSGGIGAAALVDGRCQGCRLELNMAELRDIRAAAPDEVLECEECGRILVRP